MDRTGARDLCWEGKIRQAMMLIGVGYSGGKY